MKKYLLLLLLATQFGLQAQSEFSIALDTNQIKIGEPIELSLSALVPAKAQLQWPLLDSATGLTIIERGPIDSLLKGDQIELKQKISLTSFDSGEVYLPALKLIVDEQTYQSDSALIRVFFPQIKEDQDYFDIKDPREIPLNYWLIAAYLLGGLAIVALVIWLIRKYAKRSPQSSAAPVIEDPRSPVEWALEALSQLETAGLWQQGEEKKYFSELVDILRHFLEREYGMKAMESTADELIQKLENKVRDSELRKELNGSLRLSAMVKYARQKALPHENEKALQVIRQFVEQHQKPQSTDV